MDWLRVNDRISNYFVKISNQDPISELELSNAITEIEQLQVQFTKLCSLEKDPTGYNVTDAFFINQKKGTQLFSTLFTLKQYYLSKPENDSTRLRFLELFQEDLSNGLIDGDLNKWIIWKFKNVPSTVAQLMINEISVRCHLLNGSVSVSQKKEENLVQLAFNLDNLHLGDTAFILLNSSYTKDFKVSYNSKNSVEFNKKGDSVYFIPKNVGSYTLVATGKDKKRESLNINVAPMTITESLVNKVPGKNPIYYFFQGKPSFIISEVIKTDNKYRITGGNWDNVKIGNGKIEFTPKTVGWNVLGLESKDGTTFLKDSVYVYPTPKPIVVAYQTSNNKISLKQLLVDGKLKIQVFHPLHKEIIYKIEEMDIKYVGDVIENFKCNSDVILMKNNQISKVKFIQIRNIKVRTVSGVMVLEDPLLVEVI
jgi:hypothetical protein